MANAAAAKSQESVEVPIKFVRDLTRSLLGQIRGRGSAGRRNEIAAQLAGLLRAYELNPRAHLTIAKVIVEELNSETTRVPGERPDYYFDPETGALCWAPTAVAKLLDVNKSLMADWRKVGKGPRWIKFGDTSQSPIVYPIAGVLDWLAEREKATEARYESDTAAVA